jgi:hypothetical protein
MEKIRCWEATGQLDQPFDPGLEPPDEEILSREGRLLKL